MKASELVKYYDNKNGPTISTVHRSIIEKDGLFFKDVDGSGEVSIVNDWRCSARERAEAYVEKLTLKEKIGQLFISDWRMGPKYPSPRLKDHVMIPDESGLVDEANVDVTNIFGRQILPGTSELIKEWFARFTILREAPTPSDLTDYLNQLQSIAEDCEHFVPVTVASNSRNENGEVVFGMNDASGVFATWPGTLGIAAAVKGSGIKVAEEWADATRRSWEACGLRKGYMYMADVMTDPRWQRTYGTFGEDPELIKEIMNCIIPRIQGSEDGPTTRGVAMTTKHFPGGGARENGFDPHYAAGQWNVYATPGSLQKYHIPGFEAAIAKKTSAIMPYYSKPSTAKSSVQQDYLGNDIPFEPYGFTFNRIFIHDMLREQMGFKGYINSDSGILHSMAWGVEMLDRPERCGLCFGYANTDVVSGSFDQEDAMEAYERGINGYYETHPVPEGFTKEQLVLTEEAINRAVTNTLTEKFMLGMFENTYRDPIKAEEAVATKTDWDNAALAHRQSVVLLKNDGILPLTSDKINGKKVYAEAFCKKAEQGVEATKALREMLGNVTLTENYKEADIALLMVSPSSGDYFTATPGYLEIDICEGKEVCDVDDECRPLSKTHLETTLSGTSRIAEIAKEVHAHGGKVVANINFPLAWMVGNVEPYVDALTAGFDTYPNATLDVMFGKYTPTGKLPITLPRNDAVIAVDANGVCISPNDVPGYDKDIYMPDSLKDENGKAYAYRDEHGNYYELNFGLTY